jgi:DNA polymerase elongation subunit (family B)
MAFTTLLFDLETFSEQAKFRFDDPTLKIISIQYKDVSNGNITILKEWESDEVTILTNFYESLKEIRKAGNLQLIGHNILRFDIPLLLHRMVLQEIDSNVALLYFFHETFTVDTYQCVFPFNRCRFKGLAAEDLAKILETRGPKHHGSQIPEFYKQKLYDKIDEHVRSDLDFIEDLWQILTANQNKLKERLNESPWECETRIKKGAL